MYIKVTHKGEDYAKIDYSPNFPGTKPAEYEIALQDAEVVEDLLKVVKKMMKRIV